MASAASIAGTMPRVSIMPRAIPFNVGSCAAATDLEARPDPDEPEDDEARRLLPVLAAIARLGADLAVVLRRVVVERLLATGVTSTVVEEAAGSHAEATAFDSGLAEAPAEPWPEALAVTDVVEAAAEEERRRGAGDAMEEISDGCNGGKGSDQLSIRHPVVDDSTDGQVRKHGTVGACKTGCRTTGGEHPVALSSSNRINSNKLLALVISEYAQVHVIQPRQAVGANQGPHHLHDLHQVLAPGLGDGDPGLEVAGAEAVSYTHLTLPTKA